MTRSALGQGPYLIAAALLMAAVVGAGLAIWPSRPGAPPVEVSPSRAASASLPTPSPATSAVSSTLAVAAPAAAASVAAADTTPGGADPHLLFMQAIQAARDAPPPPAPPAIAQARSLPEAFAAMRAAQQDVPPGSAALNPFALPSK